MKFQLEHHNKILTILKNMNSEILIKGSAYFGGGTLLTIQFQEYRWSKDIDFISSVGESGYKYLREVVFDYGYEGLFSDLSGIKVTRGMTDQYGIRMNVYVGDTPIKTEIIAEARFKPDEPRYFEWSSIPCLSLNDCFTSKLLANSDRYLDDSIEARDLIDLAVLRLKSSIPHKSIEKAEKAYEVMRPLKKAVERFQQDSNYRLKCFEGLKINQIIFPKIIDGIDLLANDFNLAKTERVFNEKNYDLFFE